MVRIYLRSKKKNIYKEILGSVIVICIIIFCYFTGNFEIFGQDNELFNSQNIAQTNNQSDIQSNNHTHHKMELLLLIYLQFQNIPEILMLK